ncbi:MAG: hypothetical protein V1809_11715 [Planctomycetota bacterium]
MSRKDPFFLRGIPLVAAWMWASASFGAGSQPFDSAQGLEPAERPVERPAPAPPPNRAGPGNVLVVYNAAGEDRDRNGQPDGREAAEYYAQRRGVPPENLLALEIKPGETVDYKTFYQKILTPVREKLHAKAADGKPFADRILYILLTPGVPTTVNTHHGAQEHPLLTGGNYGADRRSVDQWLIAVEENFAAGCDPATGKPGAMRRIRVGEVRAFGQPLSHFEHWGQAISRLRVGKGFLGEIVLDREGRLGDLIVEGLGKLGDAEICARLGDIVIGKTGKLANAPLGESRLADLTVAGIGRIIDLPVGAGKLGDIAVRKHETLADVRVGKDARLGDVPAPGAGKLADIVYGRGRLGEIEIRVKEKDAEKVLTLADVEVRFPPLGSIFRQVLLPVGGDFTEKEPTSFKDLRARDARLQGLYLVTRLGRDLDSARRAVDGALYAERHLRGGESGPEMAIWLDQKFNFAGDQVASQAACAAEVHPGGGLFEPGRPGPLGPWKLVIDNQSAEVGSRPGEPADAPAHKPESSAKVKAVEGRFLVLAPGKLGDGETPMASYFCPGWEVAAKAGGARAEIRAVDVKANRLELSSTEGFKAGDDVVSSWTGTFPARDCFFFFGFYGLGRYEDVFAFPPGAIGIHVDSSCMSWARGALSRGIAATYGVVNEPCSSGIPYGHMVLSALSRGNDLAEAMLGGTLCAQRWAGVTFGDPLYAPFRGTRTPDAAKPVLGQVAANAEPGGARITARLGGADDDELADVALFKIEYGPDTNYGRKLDFIEWPEPENPALGVKLRDYSGYARFCSRRVTGLEKGKTCHYRVTARDPAGNESVGADGTFTY